MSENLAARVTQSYFERQNRECERFGDNKECLKASFDMGNGELLTVNMIFDEPDEKGECGVHLEISEFEKFPPEKYEKICVILNEINAVNRWVKFVAKKESNSISAEDDAVLQLETCGSEVLRCCLQLVYVSKDAHVAVLKGIYS